MKKRSEIPPSFQMPDIQREAALAPEIHITVPSQTAGLTQHLSTNHTQMTVMLIKVNVIKLHPYGLVPD